MEACGRFHTGIPVALRRMSRPSDLSIYQEELVRSAVFRYISDAITKDEALAMLKAKEAEKKEREAKVIALGHVFSTLSISTNLPR